MKPPSVPVRITDICLIAFLKRIVGALLTESVQHSNGRNNLWTTPVATDGALAEAVGGSSGSRLPKISFVFMQSRRNPAFGPLEPSPGSGVHEVSGSPLTFSFKRC